MAHVYHAIADDIHVSNFPYRTLLPEDRLSKKERQQRIGTLVSFAKKLRAEVKKADLDQRSDIRRMLDYIGKRLSLLDRENWQAVGMGRYDFLLGRATRPDPSSLPGAATLALVKIGLRDTEKTVQRYSSEVANLIADISAMAPEIDRLLDLRRCERRWHKMFPPFVRGRIYRRTQPVKHSADSC